MYTISGLKGSFADANAGTGKTITVDSSEARVETGESAVNLQNYLITYPAQTGTIHQIQVRFRSIRKHGPEKKPMETTAFH